ncbi:cobalamin biosynthesis protein CobD [Nocardioides flavus (ex Wang et al. 2016)]|uniref:Cobalamin biosynthesis protein CobD n=1 Tax=Nocardioides flavus (ex Wang et al. 2016) TaxID=2058780 RepID=A0ABQ3HI95_9ACTN|nr:CobD/CbiB family cobalamin biosynthesis protein [Nocardioides flavus (ex Wang et al. 2016)]GHE15491.1 cobalamin biosynthesis protein CobD [Nocardioides flavus (ex Wang et al. 2016)]
MSRLGRRSLSVAGGLLLQKVLPEPPDRWHPVSWFGFAMQQAEAVGYADTRATGVRHALAGGAIGGLAGGAIGSTALAVAVCAAGRELRRAARLVETPLLVGDLAAARVALPSLVGRDRSHLDASGIAAAVVESLAENLVDAVVAPAFWGLAGGARGVTVHRAINTMDAMVGHHSDRYENFGWAAARLDDGANWIPARLFVLLVMMAAPTRATAVRAAVRSDARLHPSPNAGVAEAAVAATLGRELGGPLQYGGRHEARPRLGDGPRPEAGDIAAARELTSRTEWALIVTLVLLWWADHRLGQISAGRRTAPR